MKQLVNAEMLRYLIEHEHSCRGAWSGHRTYREKTLKQAIVDGQIKMVPIDTSAEETEAFERYQEARRYLRRAIVSILGDETAGTVTVDGDVTVR